MENSLALKKLGSLQWDLFKKIKENNNYSKEDEEMFYHFMDFIAYIKKYKGPSYKHRKNEIIFYREREWRWVPEINEEDISNEIILRLAPEDYNRIPEINKLIEEKKKYRLEFSADDVDYLFVDSEETKQEFKQLLSKPEFNKCQLINKVHILEEAIKECKMKLSNYTGFR